MEIEIRAHVAQTKKKKKKDKKNVEDFVRFIPMFVCHV